MTFKLWSKTFAEEFHKIFFLLVIEQTFRRHQLYAGLILGTGYTAGMEQTRAYFWYMFLRADTNYKLGGLTQMHSLAVLKPKVQN